MSEMTMPLASPARPGQLRGWLEVLSIYLLMPIGGVLGGLTGFLPLSAICSILLPLIAATFYLRREGTSWRSLVLGSRLSPPAILAYVAVALVVTIALVVLTGSILRAAGMPQPDLSVFIQLVEGNLVVYLWLLIPVAWGSAAIGEEMLVRGFLLHRLEGLSSTAAAVVLQAVIFAVAHFYQGISGMLNIFVLALVFGAVYIKCGRNLIPLILAHGLIDTYAMTVLYFGRPDLLLG